MTEISRYIETLSLMDSLLTNGQTKAKVQGQWPDLEVSRNAIQDARVNLWFKFRPPMIKQDLSPFCLEQLRRPDLNYPFIVFPDERPIAKYLNRLMDPGVKLSWAIFGQFRDLPTV